MRRVVISPHLDDAVLSAWSAVSDPGADVTVVTVFAGLPDPGRPTGDWEVACGVPDPRGLAVLRRAEDTAALASCGAGWAHLDHVDSAHRPPGSVHRSVVADLATRCRDADEVWLPAAIGGHPDHLAAARAGLEAAGGRRVVMYADQPYTAHWYPPPANGGQDDPEALRRWLAALVGASLYTPAEQPRARRLDPGALAGKRAALRCYITQLRGLGTGFPGFCADEPPTPEWWWPLPEDRADRRPLWALAGTTAIALRPGHGPSWTGTGAEVSKSEGHEIGSHEAGEIGGHEGDPAAVFLSVLTRTRGDQPDSLAETLSSLAAQRSRHFELVLLVHDAGPGARASAARVLAGAPAWLRQVTRVEQVDGGTPARPLNVGLWVAAGSHVVCLDDGDVAFPDWVGEFERLAASHPGQILRARVIRRLSEPGHGDGDAFPEDFDLLEHLSADSSPLNGLAFPRRALAALGLRFDEGLAVGEDWDLLLRAAALLGVATSPAVTAAWCDRGTGHDARSARDRGERSVAERYIVHKADRRPLLLPPGSVSALRARRNALFEARDEARSLRVELGGAKEQLAQLEEDLRDALDQLAAERQARASAVTRAEAASAEVVRQKAAGDDLARALAGARRRADGAEARAGDLTTALAGARRRADGAEAMAEAYRGSTSWRLTRPLRAVGRTTRWLFRRGRDPRASEGPGARG